MQKCDDVRASPSPSNALLSVSASKAYFPRPSLAGDIGYGLQFLAMCAFVGDGGSAGRWQATRPGRPITVLRRHIRLETAVGAAETFKIDPGRLARCQDMHKRLGVWSVQLENECGIRGEGDPAIPALLTGRRTRRQGYRIMVAIFNGIWMQYLTHKNQVSTVYFVITPGSKRGGWKDGVAAGEEGITRKPHLVDGVEYLVCCDSFARVDFFCGSPC